MGQADSKVKSSKLQTVNLIVNKKHTKKEGVATVTFGVGHPLSCGSTEFLSDTVWQEVLDTEAVNYCAVGSRDSVILISDSRKSTDSSIQDCEEVPQSKEEASIQYPLANLSVSKEEVDFSATTPRDLNGITNDSQITDSSTATVKLESDSTNVVLFPQESNNLAVSSLKKNAGVLDASTPRDTLDLTVSLDQETTNFDSTSIRTETTTVASNSTALLNKESANSNQDCSTTNHKSPTSVIPCSKSCTNFVTEVKYRTPMLRSESQHLIREPTSKQKRSILSHMPKMRPGKPSLGRNVRFEELVEETALLSMSDIRYKVKLI